jgi:hypothetical protein
MMVWIRRHPKANADWHLGFIPSFLNEDDERSAREQFNENYISGWRPMKGFKLLKNGNLKYPEDPETQLLFETHLRDETIYVYEHAWVAVVQPDGSFEVCRLD